MAPQRPAAARSPNELRYFDASNIMEM